MDIQLFITLLISILCMYVPVFINLKKEINDLELINKLPYNNSKIKCRENLLKICTIFTLFLIFIVVFFFILPLLKNLKYENFKMFFNAIVKFLPFKDNFFDDDCFTLLFITGIIFSLFIILIIEIFIFILYIPIEIYEYILFIFMLIITFSILTFVLIWFNYHVSTFLSNYILNTEISFLINLFIYKVIIHIIIKLFDRITRIENFSTTSK